MDPPEDGKEETSTSSLPGIQEVLPGILREVLPGILREVLPGIFQEVLAERWEATVGRKRKKTQEATDNDNVIIATKIRRLDGQQHRLGCPICLGGWWVSSGIGYIKHWERLHSKHLLQWPNMTNQPPDHANELKDCYAEGDKVILVNPANHTNVGEGTVIIRERVHGYPVTDDEIAVSVSSLIGSSSQTDEFINPWYGYPVTAGGFTAWRMADCKRQ